MQNKLTDLNNHLFAELERLGEEDLGEEALKAEIARAKAISDVAQTVIANANVVLDAARLRAQFTGQTDKVALPEMIG